MADKEKIPTLKPIKPVRFPSTSLKKQRLVKVKPSHSPKELVKEMKKLSKQGIYISE